MKLGPWVGLIAAAALLLPAPVRAGGGIWRPAPEDSLDWQLTEPFDFTAPADVLDLDLFDAAAADIARLKAGGVGLVCYLNAGAWEDWRPDAGAFPKPVIGAAYAGWAGERWLDIRAIEALAPVMRARLDLCRAKGFDSVEPDNIDGFDNDTGFAISRADQVRYNLWLADEAHQRGLSIALKNAPGLLPELAAAYDWALLEDCHAEDWCAELEPFVRAGKAVVAVEYTDREPDWDETCAQAAETGVQAVLKRRELDSWIERCP